jgi:UDP-N-acetylglucosamine 4,6-dehydratase/5-epimerase
MNFTVFGGSGYLGTELLRRLSGDITVVARNEGNLVALKEKYPSIKIVIGDVADPFICDKVCQNTDGIYYLSALKHVGLAEENVREAITTNIPLALLEATRKYKPKFIIGVSTDKAASKKGVYGCTKFLMEKLFAEYEKLNPDTKYRIVRFGNVWGSTGSFITKWEPKMAQGEEIMLTDGQATRFFFTVQEAVDLIFECLEKAADSSPYIPKMKAVKMSVVLEACMEIYGRCQVKVTGLGAGENLHECLDEKTFSNEVPQYSKEEFIKKFL